MAVKYTNAQKVKDLLGSRLFSATTNGIIEVWIEEAEGIIDTWLKIGSGTGASSFTFSATKKPHLILEMAATMIAGSLALAQSSVSFVTMEQALLMQETMLYWAEEAK